MQRLRWKGTLHPSAPGALDISVLLVLLLFWRAVLGWGHSTATFLGALPRTSLHSMEIHTESQIPPRRRLEVCAHLFWRSSSGTVHLVENGLLLPRAPDLTQNLSSMGGDFLQWKPHCLSSKQLALSGGLYMLVPPVNAERDILPQCAGGSVHGPVLP